MSDSSLPPRPPPDNVPLQEFDDTRIEWPGGLLPLPSPVGDERSAPLPIDLQIPATMPMGQVNFPFVDQQAVEQLEYLDKISVRWNWKLLATLLLFTVFLVTGALICRQRSLQNWSTLWKRETQELAAQGDWRGAAEKAKLALRIEPDNRTIRLLAGQALINPSATREEYELGRELLEEHLAEDPQDRENRLLIIRSALQRGDHRWVLTEGLGPLRSAIPNDTEFRNLVLECHRAGGNGVEAARILVRAIDSSSEDPQLYRQLLEIIDSIDEPASQLAEFVADLNPWREAFGGTGELPTVLWKEEATEEARGRQRLLRNQATIVLQRMGAQARPTWWFSVAISEHALRQQDVKVAETFWRQARESSPEHPEVVALGAEVLEMLCQKHLQEGDYRQANAVETEAREMLQQVVPGRARTLGLYEVLGRLQVLGKQYAEARKTYRAGLEEVAKRSASLREQEKSVWQVIFRLGLAESLAWQAAEASETESIELEEEWKGLQQDLREPVTRVEVAEFLDGLRKFALGHLDQAARGFEELRARLQSSPDQPTAELAQRVDLWICECHRQLAREHQLRRALERALAERPEWYQGRQELSRLLVRRGLSLHPAEEFESEPEASVDELELQLTEQTLLPASRQSWNLIDGQLTSLAEQFPKQSRIALLQAERWLDQGVVEQARKLLSDHQEKDPQNAELALALVRLLRWQENREQIDNTGAIYEVVEALRRAKGERAALRLLNAEVRGLGATQTSFDPDEIEQFWGDTETWPIAARRELACGLLKLAQRSGSDSSLIGIGRIAVGVGLRDLELLAQVAAAAERTGNRDLAKQAREAIVRVEGEAGPWGRLLSAYATLLKFLPLDGTPGAALSSAVLSELITASDDLEQASAQCPDWGLAHRLRGIAWDLLGQSEEAGKAFELAVLHGDRSAEPRNWLTDLLFRLQRDRELVELHESWSGKIRWTLLSGDLSLPGVFDLPLGVKPGREQADQLALAQLAVARKAPLEETLPTVIQLTRKAPHLPEAWQLWVRLAVEQGGAAAGRAVVQQVATAVPPQPPHLRPLIEALCWDALGEQSLVEKRFRESFEVESNNWQCTREWIFWLVRRGDFDQALSHLDAPPPRLAAGLVSGFHNWSRLMRHTLGAAGATALPEFRRHLAEMKPEGTGARNSFWQDRWWACVSRGRAPQEDRQGVEWLDLRRQSVGLTADQKVARLRSRVRLGDAQAWSDWRSETAGQPADLETTLLILQPLLRNPQRRQSPELESQIDEAFEFLRKTEPKSLRTRAVDAARALQEGFSQNGATAYLGYQQRLSAKSTAELLQDLAGAGRLERLRSRLASLAPTPRDDALPWSALDRFPNHREVFLKGGAIPELEALWKVPAALECLQDEALLLVGLGLESIADVDAARQIFAGYSRRGRQPADRCELALFLARRGELGEAQQVINLMTVNSNTSEADLSLAIAAVFASAPGGHDLWSVPLRRLEAVRTAGLKPDQAWQVRRELARLKALNFKEEQALEDCLQMLREQPDDLVTRNNLAWLRGITGQNTAEARAEIDALIERHGELPELLDTRALIGLIQGDWTQVRADLESAFAQAPIGRYLAQLAVCQAQLGERSTAQRTAQHAVQLGFLVNAWLPPERGLWGDEFNALLRESVDASPVSASPEGTDGRNPPSKTEKTP